MSSSNNNMHIKGTVFIKTGLKLEKLGERLTTCIFAGAPFGGKEENIYNEIPAIFMHFLGLRIILSCAENGFFELTISPGKQAPKGIETDYQVVDLSNYLVSLVAQNIGMETHTEIPATFLGRDHARQKKRKQFSWFGIKKS